MKNNDKNILYKTMHKNRAIVFGGTRGVGRQVTEMFLKNKIPVIFTGTDFFKVKKLEKEINKNQLVRGMSLKMDDIASVNRFAEKVTSIGFNPNILIFNAGYLSLRRQESKENVSKLFRVNAISPIILTEHFLGHMRKRDYGHVIFNSPPYVIDEKVKFLTPYMQSKLAQTTYMKSLSHILRYDNISCNSIWTKYPLWTDAIKLRHVGKKDQCVHPDILVRVIEQILFHENPQYFKGNEILDEQYLYSKGIDIKQYFLGNSPKYLDELFLSHLQKMNQKLPND